MASILHYLPPEYGYVIGNAVASSFLLTYLGMQVMKARQEFGVDYPSLYADRAEAEKDPKKKLFNCYQRAHQNALETYPVYLFSLFIGGLKHPLIASGASLVYLLGRFIYAQGYYSGTTLIRLFFFVY